MRPNGEEVLRGIGSSLLTYVLPEVSSAYARSELMIVVALLAIVADEYDGAAQRLVDDNAALRALAAQAADALGEGEQAGELRSLAEGEDDSVRLSNLAAVNEALRAAVARLGVGVEGDGAMAELRSAIVEQLRSEAEGRSPALLGPRADG